MWLWQAILHAKSRGRTGKIHVDLLSEFQVPATYRLLIHTVFCP